MNTESLIASKRTPHGKGGARKVRQAGGLPGVVYSGGKEALSVVVDPNALTTIFRRTQNPNTLVSLDLDGDIHLCLIKAVQRHPVTRAPRHVDFYQVDVNTPVMVKVPVQTTGTSVGVKLGGTLRLIRRTLDIECKPGDIPSAVVIDVTDLNVGDLVKISQVSAPEGCVIPFTTDFNVLAIVGKRGGVGEGGEAPEVEEEEASDEDEA